MQGDSETNSVSRKTIPEVLSLVPSHDEGAGAVACEGLRNTRNEMAMELVLERLDIPSLGRVAASSKALSGIVQDSMSWKTLFEEAVQAAQTRYSIPRGVEYDAACRELTQLSW